MLVNVVLVAVTCGIALILGVPASRMQYWAITNTARDGQRLQYEAGIGEAIGAALVRALLLVATCGFALPWTSAMSQRFRVEHTSTAEGHRMRFTGTGGDVLGLWLLAVVALPLSFGLAWPWLAVLRERWVASSTVVLDPSAPGGEYRLRFDAGPLSYFVQGVLSLLLSLVTLGLYTPFAIASYHDFVWSSMSDTLSPPVAVPSGPRTAGQWAVVAAAGMSVTLLVGACLFLAVLPTVFGTHASGAIVGTAAPQGACDEPREGETFDAFERRCLPADSVGGEKTKIGIVNGKGGPTLAEGLTRLKEALPMYDLVEVPLSADISTDLRALLIIAPEEVITDEEAHRIDAYVMHGGSLGIFGGTTKIDPSSQDMTATVVNSGLNRLLEPWGMRLESNIIADTQCGRAPMQTQMGIPMLVPFPPVPIVVFDDNLAENPVLLRLDRIVTPFASSITLNRRLRGDHEITTIALAQSTEQAWALTGDSISIRPRNPREWAPAGSQQRYVLIVSVEGKLPSAFAAASVGSGATATPPTGPARATRNARILVVGSAAVVRDEFLPRPDGDGTRGYTSEIALAVNAVNWLAERPAASP